MIDLDGATIDRRWQLVLPHRAALLRVAYSRGLRGSDAEACVHEALLRCVQHPNLDEGRVLPFLVTTVAHLCVDQVRGGVRDERLAARLANWHVPAPSPEDEVCDRAEATWVATTLADLPQRQRLVLAARLEGLSGSEIAESLGMSYKAVESLLGRMRTQVRATLVGALGVVLGLIRRPRAVTTVTATSVALFVVTSLVLGTRLPAGGGAGPARLGELGLAPALPAGEQVPEPAPYPWAAPAPAPTPAPAGPTPPSPLIPPSLLPTPSACGSYSSPLVEEVEEYTGFCVRLSEDPESYASILWRCVEYGVDVWHANCKHSPSPESTDDRSSR